MRKVILSLIYVLFFVFNLEAKDYFESYKTKYNMSLQECLFNGDKDTLKVYDFPAFSKFSIVGIIDNSYIIMFWFWNYEEEEIQELNRNVSSLSLEGKERLEKLNIRKTNYYNLNIRKVDNVTIRKYFLIEKTSLEQQCIKLYRKTSPTAGTIAFPFKFRPYTKEVNTDIGISAVVGLKINLDGEAKSSFSFLGGFGLANINLDSTNCYNRQVEGSNRSAVSLNFGGVLDWRGIQIGLFSGIDFLSNNKKDRWMNNSKPWFALGLGISLYKEDSNFIKETNNEN